MSDDVQIRSATLEDVGRIKEIEVECRLSGWTVDDYASECARAESIFRVAVIRTGEPGSDVVGFLLARLITNRTINAGISTATPQVIADIYNIAVIPAKRRQQVASELLTSIPLEAEVHLEVRRTNIAAIRFYLRHSFVQTGTRLGFYTDPPEDAILMTRPPLIRQPLKPTDS